MRMPIAALLLLAACGAEPGVEVETATPQDDYATLAAETVEVMEEYVAALEQVTDVASAQASRARIEAYQVRLQELTHRRDALREASPDQDREMVEKYGERLLALGQRQGRIAMRFAKEPAIRAALQDPPDGTEPAASD